jgi:hypothetical protein
MSSLFTIDQLGALAERLRAESVRNTDCWRKAWLRATPDRLADYAAEAYCALTLRRAGFAVEFSPADPPDLWIDINGARAAVDVKHFRRKWQDDLDRVSMDQARAAGLLSVTGQCESGESDYAWLQVVMCVENKVRKATTPIEYVFLHSSTDCVEDMDLMSARNELTARRRHDSSLQKLGGIALLSNSYSIRERRSFWYFHIDRQCADDPVERAISGIRRWQTAVETPR